ncbi:MAG: hypothetical protein JSS27_12460 [Planctomycetes bacterium]|nr:hypothetical protein [Planctomycetota bacterium]
MRHAARSWFQPRSVGLICVALAAVLVSLANIGAEAQQSNRSKRGPVVTKPALPKVPADVPSAESKSNEPAKLSETKAEANAKPIEAAKPAEEAKPAKEAPPADAKPDEKYTLRYKFKPGSTLRWNIEHRSQIRTTVSGTTQTAETTSESVKLWRVKEVGPSGSAVFVHSVESIDMRQKLSGRQEVHYNSQTDKEVPPGFQDAAKSVGVPLTTFTVDATGKVVDRVDHAQRNSGQTSYPSIPLPAEPVAIGETWEHTYEVTATNKEQAVKKIQMRQRMKLESVANGVAVITIDTHILSPVRHDPTIEAQLIQSESTGTVRFDIEAGQVLSQQADLDKHVVGFQGPTSSLHCVTRFTERLSVDQASTAARPAGPAAPKKRPAR